MKIPKIENYDNTKSKYELMQITKVNPVTTNFDIHSDKEMMKLIRTVEGLVRKSLEYKQYIKFLKTEIDMNECSFFQNINNKERSRVSIEIHHEPFTLFDITKIVIDRFVENDIPLNPLMIAEEVMELHYKNMVGLIPLSTTVHQLVHDGKICIPLQSVYGDYIMFLKEYNLSDDMKDMLKRKVQVSKEVASLDTSILNVKYVYLNVEGFNFPQLITHDDE